MKYDFIRNPEIEKDIPPHGYDFWREGMERKKCTIPSTPAKVETPSVIKEEVKLGDFVCNVCDYKCPTEKGMKMHVTKTHPKGE